MSVTDFEKFWPKQFRALWRLSEGIFAKFQPFRLDDPLIRDIVDDQMREVQLSSCRAERGELRTRESYHIVDVGMRVRDAVQGGLVR